VEVARTQAKVLIRIVSSDPCLISHLNSQVDLLHDKMNSVVQSVEHMNDRTVRTEERVYSIEARMDQLEVKPVACKSAHTFPATQPVPSVLMMSHTHHRIDFSVFFHISWNTVNPQHYDNLTSNSGSSNDF